MAATPSMHSGASENCDGLDQYAAHWELSSLRMRAATLTAENEALRSHVGQLQEQVALLCEDLQPNGGIVNEAAAARISVLERELHHKLCELEETSQQAQALSSENTLLRDELGRLQDRMHVMGQDSSATQARLQTLQQLYLKSSRTLPGPPEMQATRELDLAAAIEPHLAAQSPTGGPAADEPVLPPRDIVPALNEIAALQRERSVLKSQVKKLEDRCGQLSRGKEELCQTLTALKKGQSIAAGPGQTRIVNLMRRVHTMAEQLKQKDDALAEKTAYVGKLEWRLLCQHKALEEKRGKALPAAGKPPARKPQLTGRPNSPRLAIKSAPEAAAKRSAVHKAGAPATPLEGRVVTPRGQVAPAASTAYLRNAALVSKQVDGLHKETADENLKPGQEGMATERHDWQGASQEASRSLSRAFAESAQGRVSRAAASPLYMSRSQRQSSSASQGGMVNLRAPMVPSSLTASPAISEMVYSLPVTPRSYISLADAGLPSARATPALGAAESAGSAAGSGRKPAAPEQDITSGAGTRAGYGLAAPLVGIDGDSSPAAAMADSSASAGFSSLSGVGAIAYTLSPSAQEPSQAAAALADLDEQSAAAHSGSQPMCTYEGQSADGSRRHTGSSYRSCDVENAHATDEGLPVSYSGFSSDMRAAANATADSLFRQAEASSADSSQQRHEDGAGSAQQGDVAPSPASYTSGGLSGGASLQEPMGSEGVPEDVSVEELERHIRALQLEIARSDDAGVGGRLRRGSSAEYTKGDDLPMHANTPLQLTDAMSAADQDLHLRASYSMRWTLASERKQHKPT